MPRKSMAQWDDRWNRDHNPERVTHQKKRFMLGFALLCLIGLVGWFLWSIFPKKPVTHMVLLKGQHEAQQSRYEVAQDFDSARWEADLSAVGIKFQALDPAKNSHLEALRRLSMSLGEDDTLIVFLPWNSQSEQSFEQLNETLGYFLPSSFRGQVLVCIDLVEPEFVLVADPSKPGGRGISKNLPKELISKRSKQDRLGIIKSCSEGQFSHFDFREKETIFERACRQTLADSDTLLTLNSFIKSVRQACEESTDDDLIGGQGQTVTFDFLGGHRSDHAIVRNIVPTAQVPGDPKKEEKPPAQGDGNANPAAGQADEEVTKPVVPPDPWIVLFDQFDRLLGRPGVATSSESPILGLELGALEMRRLGRSLTERHREFWMSGVTVNQEPQSTANRLSDLLQAISHGRNTERKLDVEGNDELARLIDFYNENLRTPGPTPNLAEWGRRFQALPNGVRPKMIEVSHSLHWALFLIPDLRRWMLLAGNTGLFLDDGISFGERTEALVESIASVLEKCVQSDRVASLDPQTLQLRLAEELVSLQSAVRQCEIAVESTTQRLEAALRRDRWSAPARHATERFLSTLLPTATQRQRLVDCLTQDKPANLEQVRTAPLDPIQAPDPEEAQRVCHDRWRSCGQKLQGCLNLVMNSGDQQSITGSLEWATLIGPEDPDTVDPRHRGTIRLLTEISSLPDRGTQQSPETLQQWQRRSIPAIAIPRLEQVTFVESSLGREVMFLSTGDASRVMEVRWEANIPPTDLRFSILRDGIPVEFKLDDDGTTGRLQFDVVPGPEGTRSELLVEATWGLPDKRLHCTYPVSVTTLPNIDLVLVSPEPVALPDQVNDQPRTRNGIWIYPSGSTPVSLEVHNRHGEPVVLTVELFLDPRRSRLLAIATHKLAPNGRVILKFLEPTAESPEEKNATKASGSPPPADPQPLVLRDEMLYSRIVARRGDGTILGTPVEGAIPVALMHPQQFINLQPRLNDAESRTGQPTYDFTLRSRTDSGSFQPPPRETSPVVVRLRDLPGVALPGKRDLQGMETLPLSLADEMLEQHGLQFDAFGYPRAFQFRYQRAKKTLSPDFPRRVTLRKLTARKLVEATGKPADPPAADKALEPARITGADGVPEYFLPPIRSLSLELEVDVPDAHRNIGLSTARPVHSGPLLRLRSFDRTRQSADELETAQSIQRARRESIRLNPKPNEQGQLVFEAEVSDWSFADLPFERNDSVEELQYWFPGMGRPEEWIPMARVIVDGRPPRLGPNTDAKLSPEGQVQLQVEVKDDLPPLVKNQDRVVSGSGVASVELEFPDESGSPGKRYALKRAVNGRSGRTDFWTVLIPRKELGEGRNPKSVVVVRDRAGNETKESASFRVPDPPRPAGATLVVSIQVNGITRPIEAKDWISPKGIPMKSLGNNRFQFEGLEPGQELNFEVGFTTISKSKYRGQAGPIKIQPGLNPPVDLTIREETKSR